MPDSTVTLKYLLLADNRAGKEMGKLGDETDKAGHKLKAVHAVGLAAGGALAMLFKTGFDEAKDAAAGTAQLEAGIRSTHNAANVTVGGLNNLAGAVQGYSGQTDDSIVASEKLLLTFTGIRNEAGKNNDIFNQATKVTADMAAKMGGDASKYAVQLGKALNDPVKGITALTKVGVSFTEQQKKQIKGMVASGNTMGAQKVILGELRKEFGGAAKAAGDSLPGQMQRVKRSFEDVAQSVVTQLLPIIKGLADFILKTVMPAFSAIVGFIMKHKTVFGILAAVIATIVVAMKAWAIAQAILNTVMEANPIGLVVIALVALAAGLVYAYKHSQTFRAIVQAVFRTVASIAQWLWNNVLKPIFAAWKLEFTVVAAVMRFAWNSIIHPVLSAIGAAVRFLYGNVIRPVASAIGAAWRAIGTALAWVWNHGIGPVFRWISSGIRGVSSVVGHVVSAISGAFRGIGDGLQWAWDHTLGPIFGAIASAIQMVKDAYNALFGGPDASSTIDRARLRGVGGITDRSGAHSARGTGGGGGVAGMRAGGGPVIAGLPYIVGERRPELFVPDRNGRIVPSLAGLGGASTVVQRFDVHVAGSILSERDLGATLERMAQRGVKMRIGKAITA